MDVNNHFPYAPPNLFVYQGDLLTFDCDIIVHQCNVVSKGAGGLARVLFERFPQANTYVDNPRPHMFGKYEIHPVDSPHFSFVANIFSQYNPGSIDPNSTQYERVIVFEQCLDSIARDPRFNSIGIPFMIGCGLGGGDWNDYKAAIYNVAVANPNVQFSIAKKD